MRLYFNGLFLYLAQESRKRNLRLPSLLNETLHLYVSRFNCQNQSESKFQLCPDMRLGMRRVRRTKLLDTQDICTSRRRIIILQTLITDSL
jgi:hypothetical protein